MPKAVAKESPARISELLVIVAGYFSEYLPLAMTVQKESETKAEITFLEAAGRKGDGVLSVRARESDLSGEAPKRSTSNLSYRERRFPFRVLGVGCLLNAVILNGYAAFLERSAERLYSILKKECRTFM